MGIFLLGILTGVFAASLLLWRWTGKAGVSIADEDKARAAERMAEVAAMTAGLAHEIKNPLSTIGMNAQLLDEAIGEIEIDEHEQARVRRRIGTLSRETERLRGILTDFLEFAGELRLHKAPADLNEIVGELADFFHPQTEKDAVRLRVELAGAPVVVDVDVAYLKQAVLNLMLNAAQAMAGRAEAENEGKSGEIILRTVEQHGVGGREVVIHVIDTGPGMDAEQRASIFKPYFTTKRGGSGLGLPTTRRIVEAHGGRLDLVSEPGRGTDFAIVLPTGVGEAE